MIGSLGIVYNSNPLFLRLLTECIDFATMWKTHKPAMKNRVWVKEWTSSRSHTQECIESVQQKQMNIYSEVRSILLTSLQSLFFCQVKCALKNLATSFTSLTLPSVSDDTKNSSFTHFAGPHRLPASSPLILPSRWFEPNWKIWVKWDHFPKYWWKYKIFETTS